MKVQFLKFLAAGGVAALVNMGSRYVLNQFMRFEVAVVVAYLFGVAFFTQFHEPPAPRSVRALSSAQAGPAEHDRGRGHRDLAHPIRRRGGHRRIMAGRP